MAVGKTQQRGQGVRGGRGQGGERVGWGETKRRWEAERKRGIGGEREVREEETEE